MQPLFRRVLLTRAPAGKIGGIIIPKIAQLRHATLKCTVVAIGPDVNDPEVTRTDIRVGDVVIIGKHAGAWIDSDGTPVDDPEKAEFFIIQDEDILVRIARDE